MADRGAEGVGLLAHGFQGGHARAEEAEGLPEGLDVGAIAHGVALHLALIARVEMGRPLGRGPEIGSTAVVVAVGCSSADAPATRSAPPARAITAAARIQNVGTRLRCRQDQWIDRRRIEIIA